MELWATGFNAWNQLSSGEGGDLTSDPHDIYEFKRILQEESIEVLRTTISSVLLKTSTGLKTTGSPDEVISICSENQDHLHNLAIAGNERIAACIDGKLVQYPSLSAYKPSQGTPLPSLGNLRQLVANQTVFTALTANTTVYTWGDARAAEMPCLVEDLLDLPSGRICKLASGGHTSAALTTSNDLYFWGGRPGQAKLLDEMEEYPTPVDIDEVEWTDVGVGENHVIALSTDGRIWVAGENGNGQLGLGEGVEAVRKLKEVTLDLGGKRVSKVYAGYKNSFIVVE